MYNAINKIGTEDNNVINTRNARDAKCFVRENTKQLFKGLTQFCRSLSLSKVDCLYSL